MDNMENFRERCEALVLRFRISVLVLGLALLLKWDAG
jgi:hypothetical protein